MVVAIDGTVCSGKSTIAKKLAEHLNFTHLNTGAIYRALTIKILENGYSNKSDEEIIELISGTDIKMLKNSSGVIEVWLDGCNVSSKINAPIISQNVSHFSKIPELREYVKKVQKSVASSGDWVIEGRDIGTVVFPDAEVKIFMTADDNVRAMRRLNDYLKQGKEFTIEEVKAEILARDKDDMEREICPLKPAEDSVIYYNNGSDITKVINDLSEIVHSKQNSF